MSDYMSEIDQWKFENQVSVGDHSPKLHRKITEDPNLALSLSVKISFFRELSRTKDKFPEFSFTDIVNTQIVYLQLKFTARLESRFHEKTNLVLRNLKKFTGRKRMSYENEIHRIAVFSNEIEDVKSLNFKLVEFQESNIELEKQHSDLFEKLQEEVKKSSESAIL